MFKRQLDGQSENNPLLDRRRRENHQKPYKNEFRCYKLGIIESSMEIEELETNRASAIESDNFGLVETPRLDMKRILRRPEENAKENVHAFNNQIQINNRVQHISLNKQFSFFPPRR